MRLRSEKRWTAAAVVLSFAIGGFFALTRRDGIPLGSDAMLYMLQARNIAEGKPTAETGYVLNQTRVRGYSPAAYPPVLPMALAPVYKVAGFDVELMKLVPIAFFAGFLFCAFGLFRSVVGAPTALALIGTIGLAPHFWVLKDNVLAEFPLLFFCYATLWYQQRLRERGDARISSHIWLGALIYLACATKFVAVLTLVPAVFGAMVLRERRLTAGLVAAGGVLLLCLGLQTAFLASPAEYSRTASLLSVKTVITQARGYWSELGRFWYAAAPGPVERPLALGLIALGLTGWVITLRRRVGAVELYAPLAAGVAIAFPSRWGLNYLVPFVPLVTFYALAAVTSLSSAARRVYTALVLLPIAGSLGISHARASHDPLPTGLDRPETNALKASLQQHVGRGGMIIAAYPRFVALLARTRSATYESSLSDEQQWQYFRAAGVTHVLLSGADNPYLRPFVRRYPNRFTPLWQSPQYALFAVGEGNPN